MVVSRDLTSNALTNNLQYNAYTQNNMNSINYAGSNLLGSAVQGGAYGLGGSAHLASSWGAGFVGSCFAPLLTLFRLRELNAQNLYLSMDHNKYENLSVLSIIIISIIVLAICVCIAIFAYIAWTAPDSESEYSDNESL